MIPFSRQKIWRGLALAGIIGLGLAIVHLANSTWMPAILDGAKPAIIAIGIGMITLTAASIGAGFFEAFLRRSSRKSRSPKLLTDLIAAVMFLSALLVTMGSVFGQQGASLIASSGLIIAVVGFAIRSVVADTLAGIALGLEAPFKIGDWIETEAGIAGKVVEIGWRTTRLSTRKATHIILPNSQIARQRLTNFSAPRPRYRATVEVWVNAAIDTATMQRALQSAACARTIYSKDPPEVQLVGLDPEGLRVAVTYWVPSYLDDRRCRSEVLACLLAAMQENALLPPSLADTSTTYRLPQTRRSTELSPANDHPRLP
jgi:small-conductance mechanosensitive channel